MSNVIVYSKKNCTNCDALKELLKKENIEYKTVRIDTPEGLTELRMNNVFAMSAPVLQIDNKFYTMGDTSTAGFGNIDISRVMEMIRKVDIDEN